MKRESNHEQQKFCWSCQYYTAYYTKGFIQFDKQKNGICKKHFRITGNCDCCEMWSYFNYRREMRKSVCIKTMIDLSRRLSEVIQILKEDEEVTKKLLSE